METYDVVVLGSGAAGLTAALAAHEQGARVAVLEKSDQVGGTSAWSGGMLWIPCNHHGAAAGKRDSREEALTYLAAVSNGTSDPDLAAAFVDAGPEMVRWLEARTPVRFASIADFPDYHPEHPGGKPEGGRSLECPLFAFDQLGAWADRVTTGRQLAAGASAANTTVSETPLGRGAPEGVPAEELARRRLRDERGAGQALVGGLLKGCLDRGIEPRTGARAISLTTDDGRVTGVELQTSDGTVRVAARRGVVLATGGFEWDAELARSFLRGPLDRAVSVPTNTGDGLRMAMRAGAALGNMREAWWLPVVDVADERGASMPWMVNGERARPHCIVVNRHGARFANEAANYNAFGAAFHQIDVSSYDYTNLPAFMVFDRFYVERYGLAGYRGEGRCPEWLTCAESTSALAAALGIDAGGFEATVARWNAVCEAGDDPHFGRGRSAHDRWWGDPTVAPGPRSTLGPLDTPPFYGLEVRSGTLGTKGGPRTTVDGQVVDLDGTPIVGLYAAGNVMASAMGMTYGGAGGTLGPGMTFGFLAGRHAGRAANADQARPVAADPMVRDLHAQQAIRDTLMRYCRGVDRCDAELVRSAYHPDATDDHGYWKGRGWDFAAFIVAAKLADNDWTTHAVRNVLVEVDTDVAHVAHVESYVEASLKPHDVDEVRVFVGRYVDRFELRDGDWLIADRVVVHDWDDARPLQPGGIGLPLAGFARGTRGDHTDPVYRR